MSGSMSVAKLQETATSQSQIDAMNAGAGFGVIALAGFTFIIWLLIAAPLCVVYFLTRKSNPTT